MNHAYEKPRILIVDDEPTNIKMLMTTLGADYKMIVATNGLEVLKVVALKRPDLILLDIMMPKMDGYEVCARLQADAKTRKIPVIFLTAKSAVEDETKGLELGAVDYITKPFNDGIVKRRVKNHLELKQHRDHLEELVQERTAQLKTAMEAAEAGNRAKSEFLSIISHELRTPLNSILGFTSLLLGQPDIEAGDRQNFLENVSQNGKSLLKLINEMIELVRVEAGDVPLALDESSLSQLVREVMDTVVPEAKKKDLVLTSKVDPDIPERLIGNGRRLRQVLRHLMENAVKFTENGAVFLEVARETSPPERETSPPERETSPPERETSSSEEVMLRFSVQDTGVGVPADKQERIFQRFTQLEPVLTRKHGGLGLGLTICKEYVPLMGGRIWMESAEGQGSLFHFTARFGIG